MCSIWYMKRYPLFLIMAFLTLDVTLAGKENLVMFVSNYQDVRMEDALINQIHVFVMLDGQDTCAMNQFVMMMKSKLGNIHKRRLLYFWIFGPPSTMQLKEDMMQL